jgi:hypothetical protein
MAVTERRATTNGQSVAPRTGRGKSWVLAMLAPKRGLRVAPVPPKTADLTRPARGRRNDAKVGTKEQALRSNQGTILGTRRGIAVAITRRIQSLAQWWVKLNKPHTQKFGHSLAFSE